MLADTTPLCEAVIVKRTDRAALIEFKVGGRRVQHWFPKSLVLYSRDQISIPTWLKEKISVRR